jgi:hypothetical protein
MSKFLRLCFIPVPVFAFCAVAWAQGTVTGAVGGSVTDPKGARSSWLQSTVKNNETGKEDTTTSDGEGRFKAQPAAGRYTVTVNGGGFAAFTADKVTVDRS